MPYQRMTDDERDAFLRGPVRPGVLATVRADGRPHAAPIWYEVDGDAVMFTTGAETVKGRNLERDRRATLCVQDDRPPFSFVVVEGTVAVIEVLEQVRRWAARIGGRYMGAERAEEYGERNGVPGEFLCRLTIERSVSARDVAD